MSVFWSNLSLSVFVAMVAGACAHRTKSPSEASEEDSLHSQRRGAKEIIEAARKLYHDAEGPGKLEDASPVKPTEDDLQRKQQEYNVAKATAKAKHDAFEKVLTGDLKASESPGMEAVMAAETDRKNEEKSLKRVAAQIAYNEATTVFQHYEVTKANKAALETARRALAEVDAMVGDSKEAAKGESAEANSQPSTAEKDLDKLKAAKLMRWGITAGTAVAYYQPLHYTRRPWIGSVPGLGALPYVAFHPLYWQNKPETNIYCANRYTGRESEAAAARAAKNLAHERAEVIVEQLLASEKAGTLHGNVAEIMCANGAASQDCGTGETVAQVEKLVSTVNSRSGAVATAARATLAAAVVRTTFGWRSGISTNCNSRMFNFWFGYPLKFKATIPYQIGPNTDPPRRREFDVQPIFATGVGVSPNAFVSLLAGISLGKINFPTAMDKDGDNDKEFVMSFLFGIGGNLDLFGFLTK